MKRLCALLVVSCLVQFAGAAADVGFSSGTSPYSWSYAGSTQSQGVFSFQPVVVDDVQGLPDDLLVGSFIYIPELSVSNLVLVSGESYQGTVTPVTTEFTIRDASNAVILKGEMVRGDIMVTVGTIAMMYSEFDFDIKITELNNTVSSDFIDSLQTGWGFDFTLTLSDSNLPKALSQIILDGESIAQGATLSGDMLLIPEPASLAMLGLGSLLLWKRKR